MPWGTRKVKHDECLDIGEPSGFQHLRHTINESGDTFANPDISKEDIPRDFAVVRTMGVISENEFFDVTVATDAQLQIPLSVSDKACGDLKVLKMRLPEIPLITRAMANELVKSPPVLNKTGAITAQERNSVDLKLSSQDDKD